MKDESKERTEGKHGVQSMEVGMQVFRALLNGRRAMMLKDIAAAADMPASKVHRYLVSLIRTGLVEQEAVSSRYSLGPFALTVGLVAIDQLDRIRLGLNEIALLRDQINETTALAVWSERGPVIVRWERPRRAITVNVVTGTQLKLLSSAAGRVFAAWMPKSLISPLLADEIKAGVGGIKTRSDADGILEGVRSDGFAAISDGYFANGVEALGVPVFNFKAEITMALVVVGVKGMLDMANEGRVIPPLIQAAKSLSARLGHVPE